MCETFIIVVRPGKLGSSRRATWPVLMSSRVVPPTRALNTSFDSPNTPWQPAHLASHRSWPWATVPRPGGRPLKSGRTSMSQALTSAGVAVRPMPGNLSAAATGSAARHDVTSTAPSAAARAPSRQLNILHLAALLHEPGLDRVVVIDRAPAAHRAQLGIGRLHMAGLVGGAAHHQGRLAVPGPGQVEAAQAAVEHRRLEPCGLPVAAAVDRDVDLPDLAAARPGQAADVVEALVEQHLAAAGRGHHALDLLDGGVLAVLAIGHQVDVVDVLVLGGIRLGADLDAAQPLDPADALHAGHHKAQWVAVLRAQHLALLAVGQQH